MKSRHGAGNATRLFFKISGRVIRAGARLAIVPFANDVRLYEPGFLPQREAAVIHFALSYFECV